MAIEQRLEKLYRILNDIWNEWDSFRPEIRISNGFVCSLFLLAGLEATIFTSTVWKAGPEFTIRVLGYDLNGVAFGVILTVFTQFSMMLGSHVIRYSLNDLYGVIGFGLGNLLLSILAFPTVIIAPDLYSLLLVEIMISMMLLVVRISVSTMPRISKGAIA